MALGRISGFPTQTKLDVKDRKLLGLLATDARMRISELAKELRLSRDAVSNRLRRLQQEHTIRGFVPIINLESLGFMAFRVYLLLDENALRQKQLVEYMSKHKNTAGVMLYTDTWDVRWTVVAKGLRSFDNLMVELTSRFGDIIIKKAFFPVITLYTSRALPNEVSKVHPKQPEKLQLDETDKAIIRVLRNDARQSSYDIAKQLKLSSDAVLYRMKRLKPMLGFVPVINLTNLGYTWYTYAITFKKLDAKDQATLLSFAEQHPHILKAEKTIGEFDVLLTIVTDSTAHYHDTVKQIKAQFHNIIQTYQTWLASEELLYNPVPDAVLS